VSERIYVWPDLLGYRETVLADRPVAYWRLGELSGTTARDASGNGRNGTYQGSPALGAASLLRDDPDAAVQFDGSNDQVVVGSNAAFGSQAFSVECWVRTDTLRAQGIVFKTGASVNWRLFMAPGGNGIVEFDANPGQYGNLQSISRLSPGVVTYLAATYDGTTMRLYVNGVQEAQATSTWSNAEAGGVTIGGLVTYRWAGAIDEVAVYDYALPPERVRAHYEAGRGIGLITPERVATVLAGAQGRVQYRYRLYRCDLEGRPLAELGPGLVYGAELRMSNYADQPWALSANLRRPLTLDPIHDHLLLAVDAQVEADTWVRWTYGPFHVQGSPGRHEEHSTTLELQAYDHLVHLRQSGPTTPVSYPAGTGVLAAVRGILTTTLGYPASLVDLPADDVTLATAVAWDPYGSDDVTWLTIVNDLLAAGGFEPLTVTARGRFWTRKATDPASRPVAVHYGNGEGAERMLAAEPVEDDPDWNRFANVVIVTSEDTQQQPPIVAIAKNTNPNSPVSVQNYGAEVVKRVRAKSVVDQASADALAAAQLAASTAYYRRLRITTLPDPRRDVRETYRLTVVQSDGTVVVDGIWQVTNWSMRLQDAPGEMQHEVARTEALP